MDEYGDFQQFEQEYWQNPNPLDNYNNSPIDQGLYGGGGGIPMRDTRGNMLNRDASSYSMYRNPDGSYTNLPTNPSAITEYGMPMNYGGGGGGAIPGIVRDAGGGGNSTTLANMQYGNAGRVNETMGYNPYDRMPFTPTWNIADSLELREKRMNSTKDVFDRMHEYKSPAATTIGPTQSMAGMSRLYGSGASSGTGAGVGGDTTVTTQSNILPATPMPTFQRPVIDERKIESRIQEIMAPATSALKRSIRESMARRRYGSPSLERYALSGAMEGYGRALGDVQSRARQAGRSEYMSQEYQPLWQEAMTNYNAQLQNWMNQIQRQQVTQRYNSEQ